MDQAAGTYTVKLTVTDNSGNTGSVEKRVQCYAYGGTQASCYGSY